MKIFRIHKRAGKTKRDNWHNMTLWHASPNKLSNLSGVSTFNGISGMFLSPSYKSVIIDWAPYVLGKKESKHDFKKYRRKLLDNLDELEIKPNRTEEEERELEKLRKKIDEKEEIFNNDKYQKSIKGYNTIYIHKISCPKNIYKRSMNFFNKAYEAGYRKDNFGFWAWGEQVFIPEKFLKELSVINIKEFSDKEFQQEYSNLINKRYQ